MIKLAIEQAKFLLRLKGFSDFITPMELDIVIKDTLKIFPDVDQKILKKHIEFHYAVFHETSNTISLDYNPWLKAKKASINWRFWPRYKKYIEEKKGFPANTLKEIDDSTDVTLDHLHNPLANERFDKRGMVVGHVQSGKTANFSGLICKAADAGYKFIIVLAGIHNSLRAQTQIRIDEAFLGYDNQHYKINKEIKYVGVGNFREYRKKTVAHSITTSQSDFNTTTANSIGINFDTDEPIIAVVKKNATILNKLSSWLEAQANEVIDGVKVISNKPLIVIDDEADHASINTNKEELDPTRINGQIRNILSLFNKSAYVGYTATPFANIFISLDKDNLFPRNFVTNLKAPDNYIGPDKIFGFDPLDDDKLISTLPVVHRIDDYHLFTPDKHKKDDSLPTKIPESLKTAIKCFIITCAIRRVRGQENEHNSMLIHVSRFQIWQAKIKELVENVFNFYRMGIEQNNSGIINELRKIFEEDADKYRSYLTITKQIINSKLSGIDPGISTCSWYEILPVLHPAASKIQVKEIHGGAKDILDYQAYDKTNINENEEAGLSVIAIGGNKLSRGLTLEGLSISYYLRHTRMYDTLMQMGRWFGYRPGYVDLVRIFTSGDLISWFCHITKASEDLRKEFDYMTDKAGSTPEQFALRVKTHPDRILQISAKNKIRKAIEVNLTWSGRLIQSYHLSKNEDIINSNYISIENLLKKLNNNFVSKGNNRIWYNLDAHHIKEFLQGFRVQGDLLSASPGNLIRYIDEANKVGELQNWRLALMSRGKTSKVSTINGISIGWFNRKHQENTDESSYYINKSNITSRPDEFIDLNEEEKLNFLNKTIENWQKSNSNKPKPTNPSGELVRNEFRKPDKPLIMLYLLNPAEASISNIAIPFVGFAISFPGSNKISSIRFAINKDQVPYFDFEEYEDED